MEDAPAGRSTGTIALEQRLRPWLEALPLLLCTISAALTASQFFALPMLAIPLGAWLGARHGVLALTPITVCLLPMVLGAGFGPFGTAGSIGLYLTVLVTASFAGSATLRHDVLCGAQTPTRGALIVTLFVLPWFISTPAFYGFWLALDLWFLMIALLLAVGVGRAPLRPVIGWVAAAWCFGILVRAAGLPLNTGFGRIGFNFSTLADLLAAALALFGPRILRGELYPSVGSALRRSGVIVAVMLLGALAARLRIAPGAESLVGQVAPIAVVTEPMLALLAFGAGHIAPSRWWLTPIAFAAARVPLGVVVPFGAGIGPIKLLTGGLLFALCQTMVIAGFARLGAATAALGAPLAPERAMSGLGTLVAVTIAEARRGLRVSAVAVLIVLVPLLFVLNTD
ncbi:MAG: hypothetical protein JSS43_13585 [Proteobacteria bacterium]|nr:hypothetical protein [Pseudomonadota bacterium]